VTGAPGVGGSPTARSLRTRLVTSFLGVAIGTAVVTAVAVIVGVLVLATSHPIGTNRVGRRVLGWFPSAPSEAAVAWTLVVIGLIVVALAVVVALAIARRTTRPLGRLAAAADRMAAGDLAVRLQPEGDDEIAALSRSFNAMATNVESSVGALQRMEANARRFASDVSHELRTPLAAMTAVTDVLSAHAAEMGPQAARATRLVVDEIAHLDRLVADLIEISRFDAGTALLDLEVLRVGDAIASSLALRGWTSSVSVSVPADLVAVLDRRRFDVVVANLVGNAVKYGAPPVEVSATGAADRLLVDVTDRGPGLSAEALGHVFERFYKADEARARSDGSGLGLAIARENARLHGGDIEATNRADGGAMFRFTAPLRTRV
jgi:two-component system sensor histidine kinase MtrB